MKTLNLQERYFLIASLPQQGAYEKLVISKELHEKIKITGEEIAKFEIKSHGALTGWNNEGTSAEFEYEFTPLEITCIEEILKRLNKEEKLPIGLLDLYKQIVIK